MTERLFTQAELNTFLARERRETEARFADYDDLKAKADQLNALVATAPDDTTGERVEDAEVDTGDAPNDQPEDQQAPAAEAAPPNTDLETENQTLKTQLLRQQIAADKGLPSKLWKRVGGTTHDEIEADVNDLLSTAGPASKPRTPVGALKSGASAGDYRSPKERAAAALRGLNR